MIQQQQHIQVFRNTIQALFVYSRSSSSNHEYHYRTAPFFIITSPTIAGTCVHHQKQTMHHYQRL